MTNFTGFRLQVIVIILLLLFTVNCTLFTTYAQEPSPETKAKIEEIKKGVASKAAELKQEVNEKLQNKAFIGIVSTVSTNSITLTTPAGAKIITLNQDTVYEDVKKTNIKEGNYIATLGDIDDTGVLTAKKVVGLPKDDQEIKEVIIGEVSDNKDNVISVKQKDGQIIKINTSKNTSLKYGAKKIKLEDIRVNLKVVVTGYSEEEEINSSTVFVISDTTLDSEVKIASESAKATPSSSPKASPKVTPKPTPKATSTPKPSTKAQ